MTSKTKEAQDLLRRAHAIVSREIARHPMLPCLTRVARSCRRLNAELPIQQLAILLEIASNPGISAVELSRLTDMPQASVSRNIHALSLTHRSGRPGLGLIDQFADPTDLRRYCLHLTDEGQEYVAHLLSIMGDSDDAQSTWVRKNNPKTGRLRAA